MNGELWINTSSPLVILICVAILAGIIYLSRKSEKEVPLIIVIVGIFAILIRHSIYLDGLESDQTELISQVYRCLGVDLVLLLLTFVAFLWVDDVISKKKQTKSYDDSLDWFWNKL